LRRRDFLKTSCSIAAATVVSGGGAFATGQRHLEEHSRILPLNRNWRYHPAKVEGAESPGFDDSKFERIVIPHTNIRLPGTASTISSTNLSPPIGVASSTRPQPKASVFLLILKER
jgi:hypothetical protein